MSLMEEVGRSKERTPMSAGGFLKFLIARGEAQDCWDIPVSLLEIDQPTNARLPSQIEICPDEFKRLLYGDKAQAALGEMSTDLGEQLLD